MKATEMMQEMAQQQNAGTICRGERKRFGVFSIAMLFHVLAVGLTLWIHLYDLNFVFVTPSASDLTRRLWRTLSGIEGGILLALMPFLCVENIFRRQRSEQAHRAGCGSWCALALVGTVPFYLYAETRLGGLGLMLLCEIKVLWLVWGLAVAVLSSLIARTAADVNEAFLRTYQLMGAFVFVLFLVRPHLEFLLPWTRLEEVLSKPMSSLSSIAVGLAIAAVLAFVLGWISRHKRRCHQ